MTEIRADGVCGMGPAGNRFIRGRNERADEFRLTDSPPDQAGPAISGHGAQRNESERQDHRQKSADVNRGKHQ